MDKIIDDALEYFKVPYTANSGLRFPNLYDIFANILLTCNSDRIGFIVQHEDYSNKDIYHYIVRILTNPPEPLSILMNNQLTMIAIKQGLYVTITSRGEELRKILKKSEDDDIILGKVLSYPCFGDIGKRNTKTVRFYVEPGHKDIFSNLCLEENIPTFIEKCTEMGEFIKTVTMNKLNYHIGN